MTEWVSVVGQQTDFFIKKADSAILENVELGFAVPDMPAFKALNLDPSNILRPSEAKDIALVFGSFRSSGNFIIPKDLAVEVTPALLFKPWFTLQKYQKKSLLRAFTKTRLSLGTSENEDNGINEAPPCYKNLPNGTRRFKDLMELGMDAVKNEEVDLIDEMCDKFIVTDGSPCLTNQLIRGEAGTGNFLGQGTYKEAKEKWMSCK